MFETAEVGRSIPDADFREVASRLRLELLDIQQELRESIFPVFVIFAGIDGGGKGETVNLLNEWMDPRGIVTRAYDAPSDEERDRPPFWRYWRDMPARGQLGLFLGGWYGDPILDRAHGRISRVELDERLEPIVELERALADDGVLIVKFWLHLGKKAQKRRFRALERSELTSWRVTPTDWEHWRLHERFVAAAEQTIRRTSTGLAPWTIVEGADHNYRSIAVATALRDAIVKRLAAAPATFPVLTPSPPVAPVAAPAGAGVTVVAKPARDGRRALGKKGAPATAEPQAGPAEPVASPCRPTILEVLETSLSLSSKAYARELAVEQGRLSRLARQAREHRISAIVIFEGWDAAGKGGCIRRLAAAIDARDYRVIPIAVPTDEERAHHYLWRFWRHLPRAGRITVFDRSWYGRVLVERVEQLAAEQEWLRAYAEINYFEDQLVEHGVVLVKYWLHITFEEQLRRFEDRRATPYKRWKLTAEDWRNREKWPLYEQAVHDMVERTSTHAAPWTLVEAEDKRFARVKVLRTLADRLEARLGGRRRRGRDRAGRRAPGELPQI